MKKMTCRQLGGACDIEFAADSFEEIAKLSQEHGKRMHKTGDKAHIKAMSDMMQLMQSEEAMKSWYENKKKEFEALEDI